MRLTAIALLCALAICASCAERGPTTRDVAQKIGAKCDGLRYQSVPVTQFTALHQTGETLTQESFLLSIDRSSTPQNVVAQSSVISFFAKPIDEYHNARRWSECKQYLETTLSDLTVFSIAGERVSEVYVVGLKDKLAMGIYTHKLKKDDDPWCGTAPIR